MFKIRKYLNLKDKKHYFKMSGFSLVEIMVSTALFAIIAISTTDLILDLNRHNQMSISEKKIYDSLSIVIEDMSKRIREGEKYTVTNNSIIFVPQNGKSEEYKKEGDKIIKISISEQNVSNQIDFTPSDIKVEEFVIELKKGDKSKNYDGTIMDSASIQQPFVKIKLKGHSLYSPKANFEISTAISQRAKVAEN